MKRVDETKQVLIEAELMRLYREQRFEGVWSKIARALIVSTIAWVIWKPLGTFIALVALLDSRETLQRCARLWTVRTAILVGALVGTSVAIIVWTLVHYAVHSMWAKCFFGVSGFLVSGHFAFGINIDYRRRMRWEARTAAAQIVSLATYAFATAIFWCWLILQRHP